MKSPILTIIVSIAFCLSAYGVSNNQDPVIKSKYADVKIFAQASSSSLVLVTLEADQDVNFIRKSSANGGGWSIVFHNGQPGYVLTSELYTYLPAQTSLKPKKKKNGNSLSFSKNKD